MKFTAAERKQIHGRFEALYDLLSEKTWRQGEMGFTEWKNENGNPFSEEYDQEALRAHPKLRKGAKLTMCLAGAAAWVNGPTEEEILALLATQIILDTARDFLQAIREERHNANSFVTDQELTLELAAELMLENPFEDEFDLPNGHGNAVDVVTYFNDNSTHAMVRGVIRKAQSLYDKLMAISKVKEQLSKIKL